MNPEFTSSPIPAPNEEELLRRRETLQRGLRRANFAWVVIVAVIAALAFGVVWKAGQSAHQAERANRLAHQAAQEAARANSETARAEAELWNARFTEARALRKAGGRGARVKSSAIVGELARHPNVTEEQRLLLRTEIIAQLALVDLDLPDDMNARLIKGEPVWDANLERYAAAVNTNDVEIFESTSGKLLATLPVPRGFYREVVVFSPDGRFLAAAFRRNSSRVMAWRIEDGTLVLSNQTTSVSGYEKPFFSPDSRTLAIYTSKGLELHTLDTNTPSRLFPKPIKAWFSPDGRSLGVTVRTNVEIWSAATGKVQARLSPGFSPCTVGWHPDGRRLAVGGRSGELALWEPAFGGDTGVRPPSTAGQLRRLDGHGGMVATLGFSPDGSMLHSWAWDNFSALWDVRSGRRLLVEPSVAIKQLSADGKHVVVETGRFGDRMRVPFINRTGFRTILRADRLERSAIGAAMSRDGRFAATDHGDITRVWDAVTGLELARLRGHSAVFLPDDEGLLTCTPDRVLRYATTDVLSCGGVSTVLVGAELVTPDPAAIPEDFFNSISLAPDGRTLAVSSRRAGVLLCDLARERPQRHLTNVIAHFASVAADGQWLATQFHNDAGFLVCLTNTARIYLLGLHVNAAFSPDARRLAVAASDTVTLLERNTAGHWSRVARVPLEPDVGANTLLAFSPDGRWLAVNTNRVDVHLLDSSTGRVLATFTPPNGRSEGGRSLGFSADSRHLRALRDGGEIIEWDIPVVRAELARLGLDWSDRAALNAGAATAGTTNANPGHGRVGSADPAAVRFPDRSAAGDEHRPWWLRRETVPAVAAGGASLFALLAGVFVFAHQRRLLAGYARAEAVAGERQRQLDQAQHALFQSQKLEALGTLAAGVAHDFNNLLSVIRMSNQLVKRAVKPDGLTKENIEAVEQAVQHGKAIVNSMLGYSRRPVEAVEEFAVAKVVGDTVGLLSRQFLSGLILNVQIAPETPAITGSPTRLEQVLLNLILNASEAMKGSGTLTISARPASHPRAAVLQPHSPGDCVELIVSDTGPGIPPAVLSRLFEPFFTTKTAGTQRGTGLGLSMAYAIARDDGWGLDVTSVEGKSSTFRILLPVAAGKTGGRRLPTSHKSIGSDSITSGSP